MKNPSRQNAQQPLQLKLLDYGTRKRSFTRLEVYRRCPLEFKFRFVDRIPENSERGLETKGVEPHLGRIFHAIMRDFLKKPPIERSFELLNKILSEKWQNRKFFKFNDEQNWYQKILDALLIFWEHEISKINVIALDYYFIDCVGGTLEHPILLDFKTYCLERGLNFTLIDKYLQLIYYFLNIKGKFCISSAIVGYYYFFPGRYDRMELTSQIVEEGAHRIAELNDRIEKEKEFNPVKNPYCSSCAFHALCPFFKTREQSYD